ncbi:MAG TPA: F0F1 ATP synthase subunit A [bacterium]|nr:F0F1 ATP synthase subunit A [bacterium]
MHEQNAIAAVHEAAPHEAHELPNIISVLHELFPDAGWSHFLHQWENVAFSFLASGLVSFFAIRAAGKKNLIPEGLQNFAESLVEGIAGFVSGILGEHGTRHVPFLGTLFFYILIMNWTGLVPLMKSPTSAWSTTLAAGIATMVYVQATGVREQGIFRYLKHLAGNPQNLFGIILIPLMLTLNIILELGAVPFSLSLRLFANVSSEDRLLFNFAGLGVHSPFHIGFIFQLFGNCLAIAFSVIQAFVFMLLSTVYISLVLPHEEHHEPGHAAHAPH